MMLANLLMDTLPAGIFTFVLGILVVFLGMTIIILVITLVGKLLKLKDKVKVTKKEEVKVEKTAPITSDSEADDKVKAAIVAAIMAYYAENNVKCDFIVKKIKRI